MSHKSVILDCYTDEPSGYGVRPFLGTHQIHLSQALTHLGQDHKYLTIDDLRQGSKKEDQSDLRTMNQTVNAPLAHKLLQDADTIYIVMGCFVDYAYFSAKPPNSEEVYEYLKDTKAKKILFYVMGSDNQLSPEYNQSKLKSIIDDVEVGNTYRYVLGDKANMQLPNYKLLSEISHHKCEIITQLKNPIIAEIETGTGCNTPTCTYCIEAKKRLKISYREPEDIINQIKTLYETGVRHFRLGRQPNFYHYQWKDVRKLEQLLDGIRSACPSLETLHVDNANVIDVVKAEGIEFTKLISKYCTSGNITPFGIESFDIEVRKGSRIHGTAEDVMRAIEIINEFGQERAEDGFPKVLPGINLMHGLPGQTEKTHELNMKYLNKIIDLGLQTRRLFYRRMTRATGVSFEDGPEGTKYYKKCFNEIMDQFVMPMQEIVFPIGTVLRGFREVVHSQGHSRLRTLGTCSIKAVAQNTMLKPYQHYDLEVIGHDAPNYIDTKVLNN